jgi:hypothetical protein
MGDARGLLRIVHCIGGWPDELEMNDGIATMKEIREMRLKQSEKIKETDRE